MANRQRSSRSTHWPFGVVQSTLLVLALTVSSTLAQAQPVVILNTPAQGSVTSCASLLASWAVLLPVPDLSVENAINETYIGIWASNVGVDQTPIHGMPKNPRSVARRALGLEARQQIVPAPVTVNVTTQPIPLVSGNTSDSGDLYTWTPVRLPPNQYYVMYLQSLPGHRRALDISVKSDKFFVSEGASQSCLAGIVQSLTVTSSSETAQPSSTPTSGANDDTTAGENGVTAAPSKKNRTGAIVGGVLGGIGLFGLLLFLFLYCLRRRRTGQKQDIGDFLASRGVNPYRRSLTTIEQRASSYEPTRYGGILAAIGIHPVSPEKEFGQSPRQSRASGAFYARRSSYHRQDDNFDGTATYAADAGNRTSFAKFRSTDMTDMATILASDPARETAAGARRSKSSSITTFAQTMVGAVPYHPYNTSPHPDDEQPGFSGVGGGGGFARHASQKHRRHSSYPMSSRGSEGYAMSSIIHHPFSGAATQSREDDDGPEPEVMAWTGPTHRRASTALAGGATEPRSPFAGEHKSSSAGDHMQSSAGDHMQSTAGDHLPSSSGEQRSSEGGGSAEFAGGLSPDQGAALTRKKSGAASHKTGSTKASVTRKKAPELPLPTDPVPEPTGPAPPPSAYFTSGPGPSTTTVNTGASAYVPSQRDRDRRSADLMTYQNGRRSSEVFGPGTSAPGQGTAFDAFAGAKDGPVHILMPDLPPAQAK